MFPTNSPAVKEADNSKRDSSNNSFETLRKLEEIHALQRSLQSSISASRPSPSTPSPGHVVVDRTSTLNWINGQPSVYGEEAPKTIQRDATATRPFQQQQQSRWYAASSHSPPVFQPSQQLHSNSTNATPVTKGVSQIIADRPSSERGAFSARDRWKAVHTATTHSLAGNRNFIDLSADEPDYPQEDKSLLQPQSVTPLKRTFKDMVGELKREETGGGATSHSQPRRTFSNSPEMASSPWPTLSDEDNLDKSLIVKLRVPPPRDTSKVSRFVPSPSQSLPPARAPGRPRKSLPSSGIDSSRPLSFNNLKCYRNFEDQDADPDFSYTFLERPKDVIGSEISKHTFGAKTRRPKAVLPSATASKRIDIERSTNEPAEQEDIPRCPRHGGKSTEMQGQVDCDSDCFEEYDPLDDVEEVRLALEALARKRPALPRPGNASKSKSASSEAHPTDDKKAVATRRRKQKRLPYLSRAARQHLPYISDGEQNFSNYAGSVIHRSFNPTEVDVIRLVVNAELGLGRDSDATSTMKALSEELSNPVAEKRARRLELIAELASRHLHPQRYAADISNYLEDVLLANTGAATELGFEIYVNDPEEQLETPWNKLLLDRERGVSSDTFDRMQNKSLESMRPIRRFDEGSSDIVGCSWISSGDKFALACTTYSDMYNQPGNLMLGDIETNKVKFLHGHHTPRPPNQGNEAILDPLLHSTVTAVKFSSELLFSSSYDCTVKVWRADDGELMENIRFDDKVVEICLSDTTDRLAAAGCKDGQVSIFRTSESGSVVMSQHFGASDSSLYPSTMVWGQRSYLAGCLIVGYDNNINDSESNHGDLKIINVMRSEPVATIRPFASRHFDLCMDSAETLLIAGVAAPQARKMFTTRSHVRIFDLRDRISHIMELDSTQEDLNKVTISLCARFITSSGTDDQTLVWDTRMPNEPMCHLKHNGRSASHQEFVETGVTFAAWTTCGERFVTGGSDGVVKVWDPRRGDSFCHDLATLTGPITSGSFSPSEEYLLIGECTGKATLLGMCDPYHHETSKFAVDRGETAEEEISGVTSAAELLASGRVVLRDVGDGMMHAFGA